MCGIAGYLLFDQIAAPDMVHAMCDSIRHRGPDDEGFHLDGGCALGMRRLSVIDLATGHQPLSNEDGSVWIVFNGEIYNYLELRRELAAAGHRFATQSDTETVVHLYEQEGVDGLGKLKGMFAMAIWDAKNRKLLLARAHMSARKRARIFGDGIPPALTVRQIEALRGQMLRFGEAVRSRASGDRTVAVENPKQLSVVETA